MEALCVHMAAYGAMADGNLLITRVEHVDERKVTLRLVQRLLSGVEAMRLVRLLPRGRLIIGLTNAQVVRST